MSNQENNTLVIDWSPPHEEDSPRFNCNTDRIEIKNSENNVVSYKLLLEYQNNVVENRKIVKDLLENEKKDIIKFVNFPKEMRYKIYKISGKFPLKFKKELVDNNSSSVNVLVSKHDFNDREYEISVSDSDETRTFTTDVSSDELEEEDPDFEQLSNSDSDSESDSDISYIDNMMAKYLKKLNNSNEQIHKEIKRTNRILITTGIVFTVVLGSMVFLDPVRLIVESKINCK